MQIGLRLYLLSCAGTARAFGMHCHDLPMLVHQGTLTRGSHGVTKQTFKLTHHNRTFALKRVSAESKDGRTRMGVYKLLKESVLAAEMHNYNRESLIMYAACIFSEDADMADFTRGVTVVYEWAAPLVAANRDNAMWFRLLRRLRNSAAGSIELTDVKPSQFGIARGNVHALDLDDARVTVADGSCLHNCREFIANRFINRVTLDECASACIS